MQGGKMKFRYFDGYGRGEPHRTLLHHAGVDFEDIRIPFGTPDWDNLKPSFNNMSLPILERPDGTYFNQAKTVLRYLGVKYGYYPTDPVEAYEVDKVTDDYYDNFNTYTAGFLVPPEQ